MKRKGYEDEEQHPDGEQAEAGPGPLQPRQVAEGLQRQDGRQHTATSTAEEATCGTNPAAHQNNLNHCTARITNPMKSKETRTAQFNGSPKYNTRHHKDLHPPDEPHQGQVQQNYSRGQHGIRGEPQTARVTRTRAARNALRATRVYVNTRHAQCSAARAPEAGSRATSATWTPVDAETRRRATRTDTGRAPVSTGEGHSQGRLPGLAATATQCTRVILIGQGSSRHNLPHTPNPPRPRPSATTAG